MEPNEIRARVVQRDDGTLALYLDPENYVKAMAFRGVRQIDNYPSGTAIEEGELSRIYVPPEYSAVDEDGRPMAQVRCFVEKVEEGAGEMDDGMRIEDVEERIRVRKELRSPAVLFKQLDCSACERPLEAGPHVGEWVCRKCGGVWHVAVTVRGEFGTMRNDFVNHLADALTKRYMVSRSFPQGPVTASREEIRGFVGEVLARHKYTLEVDPALPEDHSTL